MTTNNARTWVVYRTEVYGQAGGAVAVCEQRDWDEMERHRPGRQPLLRAGIASESEAEGLAREGSGYRPPADGGGKAKRRRPRPDSHGPAPGVTAWPG
jgi:hypothetical protein